MSLCLCVYFQLNTVKLRDSASRNLITWILEGRERTAPPVCQHIFRVHVMKWVYIFMKVWMGISSLKYFCISDYLFAQVDSACPCVFNVGECISNVSVHYLSPYEYFRFYARVVVCEFLGLLFGWGHCLYERAEAMNQHAARCFKGTVVSLPSTTTIAAEICPSASAPLLQKRQRAIESCRSYGGKD